MKLCAQAAFLALALLASTLLAPPVLAQSATAPAPAASGGTLGFYRFPDLHGDAVVFAAEGDLWRVSVTGGVAQRLTTHPAEETDPAISPDGRTLAFTARYEGPAALYTMPLTGGIPTRWTFEAEAAIATTWTPSGELVYTTSHYSTLPQSQMVRLNPADGTRTRIPLYTATEGTWDAAGKILYFVRPAFHANVTKRYTGGTARDVWKYVDGAPEAVELTGDYTGESHSPMWWSGRVWFVTDRDGTMNLWSMDENGSDVRQHTRHSGWDVRNPDLQAGRIVYELGADLRLYDIASGSDREIPIILASDFDQLREKWVDNPMGFLTSAHLSPSGDRVALTSRGRVFVAPVDAGRFVRASTREGVRYRDAIFLPDGQTLATLSDESGEFEWVTLPATGVGEGRALSSGGDVLRYEGVPSPDGKWIAYTDHRRDLWVLEVATGKQRKASEARDGSGDPAWSSDSRWLAFVEAAPNTFSQVKLLDTGSGAVTTLTSDRVNAQAPAWDAKGDFLWFLSDRRLVSTVSSPWGSRQPEPFFDKTWEIYEVGLRPDVRSWFKPADELTPKAAPGGPGGGADARGASGSANYAGAGAGAPASPQANPTPVRVALDGIQRRVRRVPVEAGNYGALSANGTALFYLSRDAGQFGGGNLVALPITADDPKPVVVAEGVSGYELSGDGKKLLLRQRDAFYVVDAKAAKPGNLQDGRVDLAGWKFTLDPRQDFRQMFLDALRMEEDYFYDPGMHGLDWKAVTAKHLALVDRVTTRDELSDLIGRAVGELSALHTAVRGGEIRTGEDNIQVASLGARLAKDAKAGGWRIERIYQSDPDYPEEMSPLADPYLGVAEGDVVVVVNGSGTLEAPDIGALLRDQVGKQVRLSVRTGSAAPRDVIVTPMGNESNLRYADWEHTRRLKVEEDGGGRIGYVHIRAMTGANLTEWYRNFYPVFDRQGLILDVRRNSGGNIDSFLLEKLLRRAWMYWKENVGGVSWNMQYAFRGHMVVLVDQNTASDGEAFADGFRRLGLGPVIGMRTWGGEIWLGDSNRLTDGGHARAPSMGVFGPEGEWLIEQVGVVPDIEVDNLPRATFDGQDAQLDAAIRYLQQKIAEDARPVPQPPPYPKKAFRYPGEGGG
ncbi:MAG TPA: S41 family peptidase [Longimicrobiales bacterium]|nr:S41 family peptidase [Longimicrobiales bacterium]